VTIYDVLNRYAERKAEADGAAVDYGAASLKEAYDGYVETWKAYYRGEVAGINTDTGWNGEREYPIVRKSMRLPKLIARKWATTLLSEAFKITLATEEETEKFNLLAKRIALRPKLVEAVAAGFALGTSAIVAGAEVRREGGAPAGGEIRLDVVKYDNIYPLVYTSDSIEAVAFAKRRRAKGGTKYTISVHTRAEGGSRVENFEAFVADARDEGRVEFTPIEGVYTSGESANQMYCIIKPNAINDYTEALPFGQSIYADALAACDDIDLAAAGLRRDIKEGDQVTFIGRDMLLVKADGEERRRYFDNGEGRFFTIEQDVGTGAGEKRLFEKCAPEIRHEQFTRAKKEAVDWATMAAGLGKGVLYEKANPTATGVIHSEADKMQEKSLHEQYLEGEIIKLVRAICELSALIGEPVNADGAAVTWEDSVIVDTGEQKKLAMLEVDAGLISKEEYRRRFYGETPEEAAAKIAEIGGASGKGDGGGSWPFG
jgi:A118 family predicted phage portal protein